MRVLGVFNRGGGTLKTMDVNAFVDDAKAVFARHGHTLEARIVASEGVEDAIDDGFARSDVDLVLAAGGDGTVSLAAGKAFEARKPLAILPAGTMNLFARALHLPLDLDAALEAVAGGRVDQVDIATANGRPFVHQFGVGLHARLVRIREGLEYGGRLGKMYASLRAVLEAIADPLHFEVRFETERGDQRQTVGGVAVSNNPIGEGHVPHADRLDQGVLGIYFLEASGTAGYLRVLIALAAGRVLSDPSVHQFALRKVTLDFPAHRAGTHAVIDGELIALERRVDIEIHPRALSIVVPTGSNRHGVLIGERRHR